MSLAKLRDRIVETFSTDEVDNLCFDLDIDPEDIEGKSKGAKARGLVSYCDRRGLLGQLLRRCGELRPSLNWDFVQDSNYKPALPKQPALSINLDTWLARAYRISKLIDRLTLKQPFCEDDALFESLEN